MAIDTFDNDYLPLGMCIIEVMNPNCLARNWTILYSHNAMAHMGLTNQTFRKLSRVEVYGIALDICEELANAGAKPYFVGGCVRDAILEKQLSDFDIEVFGMPLADIEKILAPKFAIEKTGKAFCVLKIHGLPIDVSVPR
ncbi:MAG: hypothetical protein LBQ23_01825, partial [Puniceicoccales bacterium]|nr:hypothetical protein [Puniceicoccales bacterium]